MDAFYNGLLHPLLVPAHALALMGLGLLIGRQAPEMRWPAFAIFAVGLAIGLIAIVCGTGEVGAGTAVAVLALLSGSLVAVARPLNLPIVGALAAAVGVSLALDSPPDVVSIGRANRILIGTGAGAVIIVTVVSTATARLRRPWQHVALRIVGSWIAASAMLTLAMRLTGSG